MLGLQTGGLILALGGAQSVPEPKPVTPSGVEGDVVWMLEHDAERERRGRLTSGIVKVAAGTLQTTLGLCVLFAVPAEVDTVDASGILNTAAGAGLILDGTLALARRGPLEALVRDPEFGKALDDDHGQAWIDRRLRAAARRAKIERRVAGSLSLIGGVAIAGLGIANLADPDIRDKPAQAVLGAAEIGAALGFSSNGIRLLVAPSQSEHTLQAWKRKMGGAAGTRAVRVSAGWGGVWMSGRF